MFFLREAMRADPDQQNSMPGESASQREAAKFIAV
jgi:hypothetical protein